MRRFATFLLSLAACLACHVVCADVTQLPDTEVLATTIDGFTVMIPTSMVGNFHLNHQYDQINDDLQTDLTKAQVCKKLNDTKPDNCSANNYPPSAGIPSSSGHTFDGDGCSEGNIGAAAGLNLALYQDLELGLGSHFSKDFNAPSNVYQGLNFTAVCNKHDFWYSSNLTKAQADHIFTQAATLLCHAGASQDDCNVAVAEYSLAFHDAGGNSHAARQLQAQCSSWGNAMKTNHCSSG